MRRRGGGHLQRVNLFLIALGGAVGALARFGLTGWVQPRAGSFPWGTLAVNVLGSFLLGLAFRAIEAGAVPMAWRQGITIGMLGAFTTFSTFSLEAVALARDGDWAQAVTYVVASVLLAVLAVLAGIGVGDMAVRG